LPSFAGTSDVTVVLVIVSMTWETGGVKKSKRARAGARMAPSTLKVAASMMRATVPTPAATIKPEIDGNDMHRTLSPNCDDGAAA
jgi:hypothetical protein